MRISDGTNIGVESASRLTGFDFKIINANYPRRVMLSKFDHPVTRGMRPDTVFGSPLSYGPLLFPSDGTRLGLALTKQGRMLSGLAAKEMNGWRSVFTTAVPLPAELWRNLAAWAGAHVWTDDNDVLVASATVVALHSLQSGPKVIRLPGPRRVHDLVTGEVLADRTDRIDFILNAPETRVFRLEAVK